MPLKIPLKYIDGAWEIIYGGALPIRDQASATLLITEDQITDPNFISIFKRKGSIKVLESGVSLMIGVIPSPELPDAINKHLKTIRSGFYGVKPNSSNEKYIEVILGPCDEKYENSGGLWLLLEGLTPKGIESSNIQLPLIEGLTEDSRTATSLNHALTILSIIFETSRISHTGNIYKKVLYREGNGFWYPLDDLRRREIDDSERSIIKGLWKSISKQFPFIRS